MVHHFTGGKIEHGIRYYTAEVVPFLSLLDYTSDCRIFQNKSVTQIARLLIGEYCLMPVDSSGLSKYYPERDYCVQYRETALQFIERLFEEEGIFYFFTHEKGGHTLMLADKNKSCKTCESSVNFDKGSSKENGLTEWTRQNTFYSGKFEQRDFNFLMPFADLETRQRSSAKLKMTQKYGLYDYPGDYAETPEGNEITQKRFESQETEYDQYNGVGNYPSFAAGHRMIVSEVPIASDSGNYILKSVSHYAVDHSYLGTSAGDKNQQYINNFRCIPEAVPIRIKRNHAKPVICGPQTAFIVGPKGREIYTDKYGRVRVQFHWDRLGEKNEYASCWLRVSQIWAGKNWGAVFVPRIGHEVIVQFLEGNPDRPLITGSVYNANNTIPYQYPFDETKSGIKSHSSKGGGDADANELYFEDKMGREEFYIHAQKDFNQITNNNKSILVKNDKTETIEHDETVTINNNQTETVKNNKTVFVLEGNYTATTKAGKTVLEAAESIELKVKDTCLLITPDGIYFKAENFQSNK